MGRRPGDEGVQGRAEEVRAQGRPEDAFNVYGWTAATTMAKALEQMKEPTRAALMDAVRNMDASSRARCSRA